MHLSTSYLGFDLAHPLVPGSSLFAGLQDAPDHASRPQQYCEHIQHCEHIQRVRQVLGRDLPIVASLYARQMEQWVSNAKLIEQAGADALEFNIYGMAITPGDGGQSLGEQIISVVETVKRCIRIPTAVKLLPFQKSLDQFIRRLPGAGVGGLALYNRFYRSDCGVDSLNDPLLQAISSPLNPHYRLWWLARLSGGIGADLAYNRQILMRPS